MAQDNSREEKVDLGYYDYHSDKVYNLRLFENTPGKWTVKAKYGKSWNVNCEAIKVQEVSYGKAKMVLEDTIRAKQKKGYKITYRR